MHFLHIVLMLACDPRVLVVAVRVVRHCLLLDYVRQSHLESHLIEGGGGGGDGGAGGEGEEVVVVVMGVEGVSEDGAPPWLVRCCPPPAC